MSEEEQPQILKRSPSLFSHISEQLLIITICQTLTYCLTEALKLRQALKRSAFRQQSSREPAPAV